ncbi:MAG: hypothetical protein ABS76_07610 [Pelagibacterium sp. SCN 64-44]|nr:MAG: hypothetical protein ABS76_07610 [Pelagibacterium sp. SCN 64-44]
MFDGNPYSLSIAGGFARDICVEVCREADLAIAIGASLSSHTLYHGSLFPQAHVVQIDTHPVGYNHGTMVADEYLRGDAAKTVVALDESLAARGHSAPGIRTPALARRIEEEPADAMDFAISPGTLDPREVTADLDRLMPADWDMICGSGHSSSFHAQMRRRAPGRYHAVREYGAIGNGISLAMGVKAAKPTSQVVLFDGDGSLLMNVQELETIRRHGMKILICIYNDGAFGSEIHVLRSEGVEDGEAVFGRGDFGAVARGFGLRGRVITEREQLAEALEEFVAGDTAMVWDIHVSDLVVAPNVRRNHPPPRA